MKGKILETMVLKSPQSSASEQYRKLFSNLESLDLQKTFKSVTFSAINKHPNKTQTLLNIAVLYAQNQIKTLVIDMNTRTSELTELLGLKGSKSFLNQPLKKESITQSIQKLDDYLDVLPLSKEASSNINALSSKSVNALLEMVSDTYDKILIDTPSLSDYSEGYVLSKSTDATLLVLASRKTDGVTAKSIVKELKENHVRLLGTVLTKVNPRELSGGYKLFNVKK